MNSWTEYDPQFVRRRYNRLASIYVFFEWLFWLPRGIRPRAVRRLKLKSGDRVLEVGCGTGRNLLTYPVQLGRKVASMESIFPKGCWPGRKSRVTGMAGRT